MRKKVLSSLALMCMSIGTCYAESSYESYCSSQSDVTSGFQTATAIANVAGDVDEELKPVADVISLVGSIFGASYANCPSQAESKMLNGLKAISTQLDAVKTQISVLSQNIATAFANLNTTMQLDFSQTGLTDLNSLASTVQTLTSDVNTAIGSNTLKQIAINLMKPQDGNGLSVIAMLSNVISSDTLNFNAIISKNGQYHLISINLSSAFFTAFNPTYTQYGNTSFNLLDSIEDYNLTMSANYEQLVTLNSTLYGLASVVTLIAPYACSSSAADQSSDKQYLADYCGLTMADYSYNALSSTASVSSNAAIAHENWLQLNENLLYKASSLIYSNYLLGIYSDAYDQAYLTLPSIMLPANSCAAVLNSSGLSVCQLPLVANWAKPKLAETLPGMPPSYNPNASNAWPWTDSCDIYVFSGVSAYSETFNQLVTAAGNDSSNLLINGLNTFMSDYGQYGNNLMTAACNTQQNGTQGFILNLFSRVQGSTALSFYSGSNGQGGNASQLQPLTLGGNAVWYDLLFAGTTFAYNFGFASTTNFSGLAGIGTCVYITNNGFADPPAAWTTMLVQGGLDSSDCSGWFSVNITNTTDFWTIWQYNDPSGYIGAFWLGGVILITDAGTSTWNEGINLPFMNMQVQCGINNQKFCADPLQTGGGLFLGGNAINISTHGVTLGNAFTNANGGDVNPDGFSNSAPLSPK